MQQYEVYEVKQQLLRRTELEFCPITHLLTEDDIIIPKNSCDLPNKSKLDKCVTELEREANQRISCYIPPTCSPCNLIPKNELSDYCSKMENIFQSPSKPPTYSPLKESIQRRQLLDNYLAEQNKTKEKPKKKRQSQYRTKTQKPSWKPSKFSSILRKQNETFKNEKENGSKSKTERKCLPKRGTKLEVLQYPTANTVYNKPTAEDVKENKIPENSLTTNNNKITIKRVLTFN